MKAAERVRRRDEVRERISLQAAENRLITEVLGRELGLQGRWRHETDRTESQWHFTKSFPNSRSDS